MKKSMMIFWSIMIASFVSTGTAQLFAENWWQNMTGSAYQVLLYSFADSNGDGWGDIRGLINKLDYLNDGNPDTDSDLGVEMLWLSPIHPSASYHGYDVMDYMDISPRLGTFEDFETLIAECNTRNIKVILDIPFNHTSVKHPWFLKMKEDGNTRYGSYYRLKKDGVVYGTTGQGRFYSTQAKDGRPISYFSAFSDSMPDLDCSNKNVIEEFNEILAFWLDFGVAGFRFDAAKHIFDPNEMPAGTGTLLMNKEFWNTLRENARKINPNVFFIGEVLTEQLAEINGYAPVFDSLFEFSAAKAILTAASSGSANSLTAALKRSADQLYKNRGFTPSYLLSNHDQDRSMTVILGRTGAPAADGTAPAADDSEWSLQAKRDALAKAKLAAAVYQTLPGIPFVYYGEELGLTGRRYLNDDVARRDAFPWTAQSKSMPNVQWAAVSGKTERGQNSSTSPQDVQDADTGSLLNHYRGLARLRKESAAIRSGTYQSAPWSRYNSGSTVSYLREVPGETILMIHNLGAYQETFTVPADKSFTLIWNSEEGVLPAEKRTVSGSGNQIEAAPLSSAAYRVK